MSSGLPCSSGIPSSVSPQVQPKIYAVAVGRDMGHKGRVTVVGCWASFNVCYLAVDNVLSWVSQSVLTSCKAEIIGLKFGQEYGAQQRGYSLGWLVGGLSGVLVNWWFVMSYLEFLGPAWPLLKQTQLWAWI